MPSKLLQSKLEEEVPRRLFYICRIKRLSSASTIDQISNVSFFVTTFKRHLTEVKLKSNHLSTFMKTILTANMYHMDTAGQNASISLICIRHRGKALSHLYVTEVSIKSAGTFMVALPFKHRCCAIE